MSQELHYTSVPRGLKPGSRGFCTVGCTACLPPTLAERLEGLSGYRPKYPPHHADAALNPVNWSHLRLSASGATASVVSRVGPAGLDYTERPNKYAHHLLLEPGERPPGGPAWLLSQPGVMESSWTGSPQVLPAGRRPPTGDRPASICRGWAERTGDAGWAGVVAESFLADPRRPAVFVYDPGTDVLGLFIEAIALLPLDRRWDVTFSTYYTGLPAGMTCAWRGVLRDSAEERQARGNPDALILDLGRPSGAAKGGALVASARTGEPGAVPPPHSPSPARLTLPAAGLPHQEAPTTPRRGVAPANPPVEPARHVPAPSDDYPVGPPPLAPRPGARQSKGGHRDRRPIWPFVTAVAGAFVLGAIFGGAGVAFLLSGPPRGLADGMALNAPAKKKPEAPADKRSNPDLPLKGAETEPARPEDQGRERPATSTPAGSGVTDPPGSGQPQGEASLAPKPQNGAPEPGERKPGDGKDGVNEAEAKPNDPPPPAADKPKPPLQRDASPKPASTPPAPPAEGRLANSTGPIRVGYFSIPLGNPDPNAGGKAPRLSTNEVIQSLDLIYAKDAGLSHQLPHDRKNVLVVYRETVNGRNELGAFTWKETGIEFKWSSASQGIDESMKEALRDCVLAICRQDRGPDYYLLRDPKTRPLPETLRQFEKGAQNRGVKAMTLRFQWRVDDSVDTSGFAQSHLDPRLASMKLSGNAKPEIELRPELPDSRILAAHGGLVRAWVTKQGWFNVEIAAVPNLLVAETKNMKAYKRQIDEYVSSYPMAPDVQARRVEAGKVSQNLARTQQLLEQAEEVLNARMEAKITVSVGGREFSLEPDPADPGQGEKGGGR